MRPSLGEAYTKTIIAAQNGDDNALKDLIDSHKAIAERIIADTYPDIPQHDREDMLQECIILMIQAIKTFNPNRPTKLSTYIYTIISRNIHRIYWRISWQHKSFTQWRRDYRAVNLFNKGFSEEEIMDDLKIPRHELQSALLYGNLPVSFFVLGDQKELPELQGEPIEDFIITKGEVDGLNKYIDKLSEREIYVITHIFGIRGFPKKTIRDIARDLNLSTTSIFNIRRAALKKLREALLHQHNGERGDDP